MIHWQKQCLRRCCGMEVGGVGLAELEEQFVAVYPMYAVVETEERPPRPPLRDTALGYVREGLGHVVPWIAPVKATMIATSLQAMVKMCALAVEAEHGTWYHREEQFQVVLGHLGVMLRRKREAGPLDTFQGSHIADEDEESDMNEYN